MISGISETVDMSMTGLFHCLYRLSVFATYISNSSNNLLH